MKPFERNPGAVRTALAACALASLAAAQKPTLDDSPAPIAVGAGPLYGTLTLEVLPGPQDDAPGRGEADDGSSTGADIGKGNKLFVAGGKAGNLVLLVAAPEDPAVSLPLAAQPGATVVTGVLDRDGSYVVTLPVIDDTARFGPPYFVGAVELDRDDLTGWTPEMLAAIPANKLFPAPAEGGEPARYVLEPHGAGPSAFGGTWTLRALRDDIRGVLAPGGGRVAVETGSRNVKIFGPVSVADLGGLVEIELQVAAAESGVSVKRFPAPDAPQRAVHATDDGAPAPSSSTRLYHFGSKRTAERGILAMAIDQAIGREIDAELARRLSRLAHARDRLAEARQAAAQGGKLVGDRTGGGDLERARAVARRAQDDFADALEAFDKLQRVEDSLERMRSFLRAFDTAAPPAGGGDGNEGGPTKAPAPDTELSR